jgi:hypothetical protein
MRPVHINQVVRIQKKPPDIIQLWRRSRRVGGEDGGQFEEVKEDRFRNFGEVVGMAARG